MSGSRLLDAIQHEAQVVIDSIERENRAEIERIIIEAEASLDDLHETARKRALRGSSAEIALIEDRTQMNLTMIHEEVQHQILSQMLDAVRHDLESIHGHPAYGRMLLVLLDESIAAIRSALEPDEVLIIHIVPRDKKHLASGLPDSYLIETDLDGWGGICITSEDRRISVDNTLETRLERSLPVLRGLIADWSKDHGIV